MFKSDADQEDIQNVDPNKENINESFPEKRGLKGRPISAKARTPKNRYRPNSANRAMSGKRRGIFKAKDVNPILLSRIKPKRMVINRMGKEKLWENNVALQMQFNKVKETNLRLKTKIHRLNKDLERHEDMIEELRSGQGIRNGPLIRNFHLVGNLKTKIAELQVEVKRKDDELALIKRSTRATKLLELEVQMQAYIDECTRLKHHLEEILKEKDYFPADYGNADVQQHTAIINNLRRENQELHAAMQSSREDVEKWRKKALEKQSKSIKTKKGKSSDSGDSKLEQEIMKQKSLIKQLQDKLADVQNGSKEKDGMISLLQAKIVQLEKAGDSIVVKNEEYKFVPEPPSGSKPRKDQPRAKKAVEKPVEQSFSFEEAADVIASNESQPHKRKPPAPIMTETPSAGSDAESVDPIPKIKTDDVQEILKHVSLRMQLHRLQKKDIGSTLFGKHSDEGKAYNVEEVARLFKEQPFEFTDPMENNLIARFLIESGESSDFTNEQEISQAEAPTKQIVKKLMKELPDWTIFNPTDEKTFDKEIAIAISSNVGPFESACKVYDSGDSGFISLKHFESVTNKLGIKFSDECDKYIHLLFYSHSFELGRVPYQQFIDAYGNVDPTDLEEGEYSDEEEEDDLSEEERAAIVRECLKVISEALKGQKPADVFKAEGANLYPGEFLAGLRNLGVPDFDKQVFIIFIESLQSEEEEEQLCIDFEYFENLLDHYAEASYDNEGQKIMMETGDQDEAREVQRSVSILDSPRDQLEYSGDEDKHHKGAKGLTSEPLSENSPFKSVKKGKESIGSAKSIEDELPGSVIEHSDKEESYDDEYFDEEDIDSDFEMSQEDSEPIRVHSR